VLRGERVILNKTLSVHLELLAQHAGDLDSRGIKKVLQQIVPEYVADYSV